MRKFIVASALIPSLVFAKGLYSELADIIKKHGKECAPVEVAKAETYIDAYYGFGKKDVELPSVDRMVFKDRAVVNIEKAKKKIYSDTDGDGVPCYKEIENGTNPYVPDYPKVAKVEKPKEKKVIKEKKAEEKRETQKPVEKPLLTHARIHFEFDSAKIKREYLPYLNVISHYLKKHKNLKVKIIGYTDNIGSKKYNDKLAYKRALAVKKALIKFGISPDRIEILGKGKSDYLFDNKTSLNRFTNRRADFFVVSTK